MKRLFVFLVVTAALLSLACVGCAQTAPAAAPTKGPEPTKAEAAKPTASAPVSSPTQVPAQPTAAPKVNFPEKGKAITLIVPYAPGGGVDGPARLLAPLMEKELGVPVQVLNKEGAGSQVGITELAKSKPDGYTIGYTTLPPTIAILLDPERKAAFTRKDLQPIGLHVIDIGAVVVKADSPYKTLKDLADAAKAKPGAIKSGTDGIMGADHLATLLFDKLAGVDIGLVHFSGAGPANTALLGGHIDVRFSKIGSTSTIVGGGEARILAIMDKEESEFAPGVKTAEAQGYKMYFNAYRGICAPAGTPAPIVELLTNAMKKGVENPEHVAKMKELSMSPRFMNPQQFAAAWDEMETTVKPLMEEAMKAR